MQVRIKRWFLEKNTKYAEKENWGGVNEFTWWTITRETEKAYHVDETHLYTWKGGWLPKSAVWQTR